MRTTRSLHTQLLLLSALTIACSALIASTTWASTAPSVDSAWEPLEATIVSRHRQPITVKLWVGATMHRLGTVRPNQRRTFELPAEITPGVTYVLVSDCGNAHRIVSDPIVASVDAHPQFTVSLTQEASSLRFDG